MKNRDKQYNSSSEADKKDNNVKSGDQKMSLMPWFLRDLFPPYRSRIFQYFLINADDLLTLFEKIRNNKNRNEVIFSVVGMLRAALSGVNPNETFLHYAQFTDVTESLESNNFTEEVKGSVKISTSDDKLRRISIDTLVIISGKPADLFSKSRAVGNEMEMLTGSRNYVIYRYGKIVLACSPIYSSLTNPINGHPLPEMLSNLLRSVYVGGKRLLREGFRNSLSFDELNNRVVSRAIPLFVPQALLTKTLLAFKNSKDPFIEIFVKSLTDDSTSILIMLSMISFFVPSAIDLISVWFNVKEKDQILASAKKSYNAYCEKRKAFQRNVSNSSGNASTSSDSFSVVSPAESSDVMVVEVKDNKVPVLVSESKLSLNANDLQTLRSGSSSTTLTVNNSDVVNDIRKRFLSSQFINK